MKKRNLFVYSRRVLRLLKELSPEDLSRYAPHYSEMSLKHKIFSLAGFLSQTILLPVFKLYYVLQSKDTPIQKKLYIMGGLGYFILPTDLLPDFLPALIGFTDDLVVIAFVMRLVKDHLTPELEAKAELAVRNLRRGCKKKSHPAVYTK